MTRYVMVADIDRCVGCQTCTAACRHANATSPAVQWRKVLDIESGVYPDVNRSFVPVGCQHCADPPCMHVCPTTATRQREDGIVTIDYDICIGCAYCDVACPYQARFKLTAPRHAYDDAPMQHEILREDPRRLGVAQKCTYCVDRIDEGVATGRKPGADPLATPACVNACIADALVFGDLDDSSSAVSRLLRDRSHFRMHAELGTEPGFYYLYDRHTGNATAANAIADDVPPTGAVRSRGVEPWHQEHWEWKAATNFMCGGAGAGLLAMATVLDKATGMAPERFAALGAGALALIALGLTVLLFKIGRPLRFIYVLRQPQRSWMSREAWIAALLFPVALFALWQRSAPLTYVAALLGVVFMYAQAMIVREARGIPAWRSPRIVGVMMATGFAEGAALLTLASALDFAQGSGTAGIALAALTAVRWLAWRHYMNGLRFSGAPLRSLSVLTELGGHLTWWGSAIPLGLLAAGALLPSIAHVLFGIAAASVFAAGWLVKHALITRAGYNQGYALQRTRAGDATATVIRPGWAAPRDGTQHSQLSTTSNP